jgi:hypothetical protein
VFRNRYPAVLLCFALGFAAACGDDGGEETEDPVLQDESSKARVKFKTGVRIANDLSQALEISTDELCSELTTHDCFAVHNIVLGGVEPYRLRIDEPLPTAPVAAPLAVERIAITACGERATRDFDDPDGAAIFGEVAKTADAESMATAVNRLYERLLARAATAPETDALIGLYDDLGERAGQSRTWAQLSCFAIATSTEFLFY